MLAPSQLNIAWNFKNNWLGHFQRMEGNQLLKITLYGELEDGKRSCGEHRKRYRDQIHALLKKRKLVNGWNDLTSYSYSMAKRSTKLPRSNS